MEGRWRAIERVLDGLDVGSAMDIGAAEGFYSLRLADRGVRVIAVEAKARPVRILAAAAAAAAERSGARGLAQLRMTVGPDTVGLLPTTDATVMLSVWHHWVRVHGLAAAIDMLTRVWERTAVVLFFETGEQMTADYGLPELGPDPRSALVDLLRSACPDGEVRFLGRFPERHLFAVSRRGAGERSAAR